jgi:hypothetical protein
MHQGAHPGFAPAGHDRVEIRVEIAEHDVTVRINQRGCCPGD